MLFISLGKWKCQSKNEIYGASSLFWVMIRFFFHFHSVSGVFPFAMRWRKGLKRFYDNSPRLSRMMIYFRINVTIKRDFSFLAHKATLENPWNVIKHGKHSQLQKVPRDCGSRVTLWISLQLHRIFVQNKNFRRRKTALIAFKLRTSLGFDAIFSHEHFTPPNLLNISSRQESVKSVH